MTGRKYKWYDDTKDPAHCSPYCTDPGHNIFFGCTASENQPRTHAAHPSNEYLRDHWLDEVETTNLPIPSDRFIDVLRRLMKDVETDVTITEVAPGGVGDRWSWVSLRALGRDIHAVLNRYDAAYDDLHDLRRTS